MMRRILFIVSVLILLTVIAGCSKSDQSWTVSTSDGSARSDVQTTGRAKYGHHPRLSKETFNKLAAHLEQLVIELRTKGEKVTTEVDEWGYIKLSGNTVSNARRREIADHIFTKFEGARWVYVDVPEPIIEGVKRALTAGGEKARDQGGDNFRFGFAILKADQVRQAQNEGALILDGRSPEEFEREHIKGAINVPLAELGEKRVDFLNNLPTGQLTIFCFAAPDEKSQLNPLVKKIVFERKAYVAVLDASLDEWAQGDHPTEGSEAGKRVRDKFKRSVDKMNKAWSEFMKQVGHQRSEERETV